MNKKMNISAAASQARLIDPDQVGGVFIRFSRASTRAAFLRSSADNGRPVRPRVVTDPAAVPRCLVRRFFLV